MFIIDAIGYEAFVIITVVGPNALFIALIKFDEWRWNRRRESN